MSQTTFIELDSNGNIIASADWKFSAQAIETEEPILRASDGRLYRSSQLPKSSLSELQQQKLLEAKAKIEAVIYAAYPLHKQLNLSIYGTEVERQTFMAFKNTQVNKYEQLISSIQQCQSAAELMNLDMDTFFNH